jgi:hypothetical protein
MAIQQLELPLADGNKWAFCPRLGLPRGFGLRDGKMCEVEQAKYAHIADATERLFEFTLGGEVDFEDVIADLAVCLSANYRVTKWEALALQLFTESNIGQATSAALDILDICGYQKKTGLDCIGRSYGSTDE